MAEGEKSNTATILGGVAAIIVATTGLVVAFKPTPESLKPIPSAAPEVVRPAPAPDGGDGTTQTINGNNNLQVSGSNNVVNPLPVPKPCRDKSHGIERYARTFDVERTSQWMGGGYSQDPWCNDVISELRGQNPEGTFEVLGKSENTKNTCSPFNCPQYQYFCKVRVNTDPIYVEKLSSACK